MTKIIHLKEEDEYIQKDIEKLAPELAVYSYESGSYEGSGFVVFKKENKWFYDDLGHCSCYGPTENLDKASNMPFTFEQIQSIENNWNSHAREVVEYITKNKLNE